MRKQNSSTAGFTIVELLIVIVVIAILAAISIVAYRGIQERAGASEATSGLAQAKKKLELYKVDNGSYPTSGNLASAGVTDTDVSYQYTSDGTTYCLTATVGSTSYTATNTSSPTQRGCPGHGQGGTPAVTNLAVNPSVEGGTLNGYAGAQASSTIALSSTRARSGSSSILITMPSITPAYAGVNTTQGYTVPTPFKANTTYTYSAWVYVPTGTVNVFLSAQGAVTSSDCNSISTSQKDSWIRMSCSFATASTGTVSAYVLNANSSTAGMQFYVDDVMFTEGPTVYSYADGNSPNWIWNGTPNNSPSTGPSL